MPPKGKKDNSFIWNNLATSLHNNHSDIFQYAEVKDIAQALSQLSLHVENSTNSVDRAKHYGVSDSGVKNVEFFAQRKTWDTHTYTNTRAFVSDNLSKIADNFINEII